MKVTIQDACQRLGISDSTMRRRIRGGRVHAEKEGNIWMVVLPDGDEPVNGHQPSQTDKEVEGLHQLVGFLQEQITVKDGQIGQLLSEMTELRQLALPAPSSQENQRPPWWRRIFWG